LRAVEELPRPIDVAGFQRALATTYPPALRAAGRSGEVTVRFIVEPDGKVSHVSVVRSSDKAFDAPTVEAVRTLRFRPAKVGGRPARVWVMQPVQWVVADEAEESGGSGRP
jgi:TonB family protein